MSRRIDIELTSARDEGTWTWRAAGAKQPKGVLDAKLLYDGAKAGDVVKAEAEFEIEGITIIQVLPPKEKKRSEPDRLELIGPSSQAPLVTSSLVPKSDRRRERGDRDGEGRGPRREGERGPRREGDRGPRRDSAPGDRGAPRGDRPGRPPRAEGDRSGRPGVGRGERTG